MFEPGEQEETLMRAAAGVTTIERQTKSPRNGVTHAANPIDFRQLPRKRIARERPAASGIPNARMRMESPASIPEAAAGAIPRSLPRDSAAKTMAPIARAGTGISAIIW